MRNTLWRMKDLSSKLLQTGFFSVFGSNVLCKVLGFLGGIIIVRVLTKSDYGTYTYVTNCFGILYLLYDLGCSVSVLQFCNEAHNDRQRFDGFFSYGFRKGMIFLLLTCVLLLVSPLFYPFRTPETARMTQWLCIVPLIDGVNSYLQANLRVRLLNNRFATLNLATTLIHYLVILPTAYFYGVEGAILSKYAISLLTLTVALIESRGVFPVIRKELAAALPETDKRNFLKLAFASQLNNGIDQGLMLLDVFLIGIFVVNTDVISSYKVAMTIPSALAFIPSSVMIYVIPYFVRHNQDKGWVRANYYRLIKGCALGNGIIVLGGLLVSDRIIPLIFGAQYADAVRCFQILLIGYFFSATFRTPSANIIYSQRKVRVNLIITILTGVANCILDVVLILNYGSVGAATATTLVHMISSAISFGYLSIYLKKD